MTAWPPTFPPTNPEGELPDPDEGVASLIVVCAPGYSLQPRARPPKLPAKARSRLRLGLPIALPQTTRPTETPDPELTQLAREKTPSTAPMVTLVMQAAGPGASSAVVTASRGVPQKRDVFSGRKRAGGVIAWPRPPPSAAAAKRASPFLTERRLHFPNLSKR